MATVVHSSSTAFSVSSRDGFNGGTTSTEYPYSHKRGGSTQMQHPRMPKTKPPSSPPPSVPTYDFQFDQSLTTPSPFKRRDLIARTPVQMINNSRLGEWPSTIPVLSPNNDGGAYRQVDIFKRPDALTPENSSEDDREVEETPIYLRSERYRQSPQDGRFTPNSPRDEEYDADSILGEYNDDKRYSSISDNGKHSTRSSSNHTDQQPYEAPNYIKRTSWTRRDITPSKIPIFQASPKPIPMEYIFRSAPLHRSPSVQLNDLIDDSYNLKRVRSESLLDNPTTPSARHSLAKRKYSTLPRPRSQSLSSVRPSVTPRSAKFTPSPGKRPPSAKGEPPWIQHNFSPNPSLPPEEQLIPTVAKRLNQERLEREKGLVTVWDRDMRPLEGDRRIRESKVRIHKEADDMPTGNIQVDDAGNPLTEKTWPLNLEQKRPNPIDSSLHPPNTPVPISPGGPVRVDAHALSTTLGPMQRFDAVQDRRNQHKDDVNKGCCCILM